MNENDKKKLLYRANYRGFKEADLLLGGFLKENIDLLSDQELKQFEKILSAKDHDIYAWITGNLPLPEEFDLPVFQKLKEYRPEF